MLFCLYLFMSSLDSNLKRSFAENFLKIGRKCDKYFGGASL